MYKIFIVEDEFLVREGIRNKINWENTQFMLSGETTAMALAMIRRSNPIFWSQISDIHGWSELSRIVKRTLPDPYNHPGGHDEFEYARRFIGVDEYILKPIN